MFNIIKTIWWSYVILGVEQELHNYEDITPYRKPNWIYRIHMMFDKELRCEVNDLLANKTTTRIPRSVTTWNTRNYQR